MSVYFDCLFKKYNTDKIPVNKVCRLVEILLHMLFSVLLKSLLFFPSIEILKFYVNAWLNFHIYNSDKKFPLSLLLILKLEFRQNLREYTLPFFLFVTIITDKFKFYLSCSQY